MIVVRPLLVLGYIHVLDPHLSVADVAEGVHERCLAGADGFYLRSGKHNPRLEGLQKFIIE